MKQVRVGEASVDRAIKAVVTEMNNKAGKGVCVTSNPGTITASIDITLFRPKVDMTLTSIFLDVDAAIALDPSNYWKFQFGLYRHGYANRFKVIPSVPFKDTTETVGTNRWPIGAHAGLYIPFNTLLVAKDILVLEITKVSAASNLDSFFIQTDLTRAA